MGNRFVMVPLAIAITGVALPAQALEITANGNLSMLHTDNARKSDANKISELQEIVSFYVAGEHGGEALTANFRYMMDRQFYNDNSQDDDSRLEGLAELRWEQIDEALFWELSHRRKDVLQDNAQVDIRENRDERDISEISPLYIMRLSPVDSLEARLNYGMVIYREADDLDSQRYGGSLAWRHSLSQTDTAILSLESNEVDFDSNLQSDYRYDAASVAYSTQLARLNYTIRLGYNQSSRDEGEDFSGPLYEIFALYDDGLNQWQARLNSQITDSSIGDGNRDIFDAIDQTDTTLGEVDMIEKTSVDIGVSSGILCDLCRVGATLFYDEEDYDQLPRDNTEYGIRLNVAYRLSSSSDLSGVYQYRDVSFGGDNLRSDYELQEIKVEYGYRVTNDLRVSAFAGWSERSSSEQGQFAQDYTENRLGVQLSYQFY